MSFVGQKRLNASLSRPSAISAARRNRTCANAEADPHLGFGYRDRILPSGWRVDFTYRKNSLGSRSHAYQQTQGGKLEKAMTDAGYVASFIRHEPGKAPFIAALR
jgi:hypothetical protein